MKARSAEKGNVLTVAEFKIGDNLGGNLLFSKYPYYPMSVIANQILKFYIFLKI